MRGLLIVLLILNLVLGYNIIKKSEKEVVELKNFTDYYTDSEADNGGYILLSSNFTVYEKKYKIIDENERNKRKETIYYTVVSGDTLGGIANKFEQSQSVLKFNNPKVGKVLKIGQKLKITSENSIEYKVGRGDSLSKIATKFGKTVKELQLDNHLTTNTVRIDQVLKINNPKVNLSTVSRGGFDVYWPVAWKGITSPYGRRFHPVLKRWIGNMGVDLRAHYLTVKS
jgi:LysM repeat protein